MSKEKSKRAIYLFSESFGIATTDLQKWIGVYSVLSAWWNFEENSKLWKNELNFAKIWQD